MKSDLPRSFKEGDELTASIINGILGEIWRWRATEGMPPIHISETDSDMPPVISFFQDPNGQIYAGTTGGGFGSGSPTSPTAVTSNCTIYLDETETGWTNASTSVTNAYSIYSSTIAASKTAYYWKSPSTGNYYIVTADC